MKQKNYIGAKTAHGSLKREGTRKVITMILVNDVRCLLTSVAVFYQVQRFKMAYLREH